MMIANCARTERRIAAQDAVRGDGPFCCPECLSAVILHKGPLKMPHFAHKPPVSCEYGQGETDAHRDCKMALFAALQIANIPCELEKPLDGARPDIYFLWHDVPCAIEVQRSNLSVEKIEARTIRYHALGVFVLWLALYTEGLQEQLYAPRPWEKWLHSAYLGYVYYWRPGRDDLFIQPVHFEAFRQQRDYQTWYEREGEARLSGGYAQTSKRYKKPILAPECHLLADFRPALKSGWQSDHLILPPRRLFLHTEPRRKAPAPLLCMERAREAKEGD